MKTLFFEVVRMSTMGSLIMLLYLILRPVTSNCFNANWNYITLKIIMMFFIIPTSIFKPFINHVYKLMITNREIMVLNIPQMDTGIEAVEKSVMPSAQIDWILFISFIWLFGAIIKLIWYLSCYVKFYYDMKTKKNLLSNSVANTILEKHTKSSRFYKISLYFDSSIQSPMVIGYLSYKILIPFKAYSQEDLSFILKHELTHIYRLDIYTKALLMLIASIHWFNPMVYLLRRYLFQYIEYSCDEAVVDGLSYNTRKQYGFLLLESIERRSNHNAGICLSTTKKDLEKRILMMLNSKKMKFRSKILSAAVAVSIIVLGSIPVLAAELSAAEHTSDKEYIWIEEKSDDTISTSTFDTASPSVSEEFVQKVLAGEVEPLSYEEGVSVTTVGADGENPVTFDFSTYAYCNHNTDDVYVYKHRANGDSCIMEKWNGIKCTKCNQVWTMDMFSSTYYPNCPH